MVSFYLVRHGESESSTHGAGLTALGRQQAAAVGRRLAGITFEMARRSDMSRAVETAEILAAGRGDLEWRSSPALRELDFSTAPPFDAGADGYRAWEIQALLPMEAGLREWIAELASASPGTTAHLSPDSRVLVVAHSGPIRLLLCLLLGISVEHHWSFRVDHGSLSVVDRGADMGSLLLLNDRCHLEMQHGG